ncbi:MAG: CHASE2 domain-containing protein [Methylacidiphilales bacterium]|nr:CHASE2 domain-containing protein [Candidatus Methylacidiphilales bacterium]
MKLNLPITQIRWICLGLGLILSVAAWVAHLEGFSLPLERRVLAQLQRLKSSPVEPPVMLVTIQDAGQRGWPWSSLDYAVLMNALGPFHPEVVALSIPLLEGDPVYRVYDIQLGKQIEKLNKVVLSCSGAEPNPFSDTTFSSALLKGVPPPDLFSFNGAGLPIPEILRQAPVGLNILPVDGNGLTKKIPLLALYHNNLTATFLLQVYAEYLKTDWRRSEYSDSEIILRNSKGRELARIPVDKEGCLMLHYHPDTIHKSAVEFYQAVVASEQVRNGLNPIMNISQAGQKIVLVGAEVPGTYSPVHTPVGKTAPVRVQYQALENLFNRDFTRPLAPPAVLGILLLIGIFASQAALLRHLPLSLSLLSLAVTLTACGSALLYEHASLWVPAGLIILTASFTWIFCRALFFCLYDPNPQQELDLRF